MKTNELISCYVKIMPTGEPIVSKEFEDEVEYCLYKEIRITRRVKELVEKQRDGHRISSKSLSAEEKHQIGLCYWYGCIVPLNFKKAVKYYRASAEERCVQAEWCLYVCYRDGNGVHANKDVAKEWLMKSAKHGSSRAQLTIAKCYYDGQLFNRNRKSAKKWFERASENAFTEGDAEVLFCLGILFYNGNYGMTIDIEKAIKHFTVAAERKDALSIRMLIEVYWGLSNMEEVNHWKEELKKCPYPVPNFLQYK